MRVAFSFILFVPCVAFVPSLHSDARYSSRIARYSTAAPSLPEGLIKTVTQQGDGEQLNLGDIATVKYSCYLPEQPKKAPFARSSQQKILVGDGSMIEGWDKALRTMRVGERSVIRITSPNLGYGETGVPPLVPKNAIIEMDVEILNAQPATTNIDFDQLAMADSTPRTAADIAAAFEARQAAKGNVVEKEGLEGMLEKAKNFYFFGLFEGETGERPPWFLRPSITFPLAFLIVGAAFYISYAGGGISERGAQQKDELDEIILSSNAVAPSVVLAINAMLSGSGVDLGL